MTNKEFEAKKQELLDIEIRAEFGYVDHENLSVLHEKIKQLQPPRPTCVTCNKHKSNGGIGLLHLTHCTMVKEYPTQFSCIQHSDYGDEK